MPVTLYNSAGRPDRRESDTRVLSGKVVNDCEGAARGNVLVRVPALGEDVWARLVTAGGGQGAGFYYQPRIGDEVLVLINGDDAYLVGGMYNGVDRPPIAGPLDARTKRVIQTGLQGGEGHRIEFDDAGQSITIESSTNQKIFIDPGTIEVSNAAGTLKITLASDLLTVTGTSVRITATQSLKLDAPTIDVAASGSLSLTANTNCTVKGARVDIN